MSGDRLHITAPRDGAGKSVVLVDRDLLELSWQADDGLRSVSTEVVALSPDSLWEVEVRGRVSRLQRRDWVRAPIGLAVRLSWGTLELVGSTVDLSENGCSCVLRPHGDLGARVPLPRKGERMDMTLDLHSRVVDVGAELLRRVPREDVLHEWSLTFVELPEQTCDLIRSHVFTALRNARARDLSTLY
ncbi:PilZ domain-containing protein [Modestobacter sp. URMC 112]